MQNRVGLMPLRRGRMPKIPKLQAHEDETVPVSLRAPKELLRRVVSIAKAAGVDKTSAWLHFVEWGVRHYEADYGTPPQVTDEDLIEKRGARKKRR
jgi:hypothetical protein